MCETSSRVIYLLYSQLIIFCSIHTASFVGAFLMETYFFHC